MDTARPVTHRLVVRGQKVMTRTPRRYAVVDVRPEEVVVPPDNNYGTHGVLIPYARVEKRTDSLQTAVAFVNRHSRYGSRPLVGPGSVLVIIDLTTGQEVAF